MKGVLKMNTKKYYWLKSNGKVEEVSEKVFNLSVERNLLRPEKPHTLVMVSGRMIRFCWGTESVWIKKKQLEQILKIRHTIKFKKGQPASWDELDTLILNLPVKSKKEKEHPISIFDRDCEILVRY